MTTPTLRADFRTEAHTLSAIREAGFIRVLGASFDLDVCRIRAIRQVGTLCLKCPGALKHDCPRPVLEDVTVYELHADAHDRPLQQFGKPGDMESRGARDSRFRVSVGNQCELFNDRVHAGAKVEGRILHLELKEGGFVPSSDPLVDDSAIRNALAVTSDSSRPIGQPTFDWFGDPQSEQAWDLGIHSRRTQQRPHQIGRLRQNPGCDDLHRSGLNRGSMKGTLSNHDGIRDNAE